jgi:hypothetical protein
MTLKIPAQGAASNFKALNKIYSHDKLSRKILLSLFQFLSKNA